MAGGQYAAFFDKVPAQLVHSSTASNATTIRRTGQTSGAADSFIVGGTVATDAVEVTAFNGGTVAVGTAAVELTFTGTTQSIMITADFANGSVTYIGGSDVTNAGANAMTFLQPDQSVTIELNDGTSPLYAVGAGTSQKVYKVALT